MLGVDSAAGDERATTGDPAVGTRATTGDPAVGTRATTGDPAVGTRATTDGRGERPRVARHEEVVA
jgi:hypothetical protein